MRYIGVTVVAEFLDDLAEDALIVKDPPSPPSSEAGYNSRPVVHPVGV